MLCLPFGKKPSFFETLSLGTHHCLALYDTLSETCSLVISLWHCEVWHIQWVYLCETRHSIWLCGTLWHCKWNLLVIKLWWGLVIYWSSAQMCFPPVSLVTACVLGKDWDYSPFHDTWSQSLVSLMVWNSSGRGHASRPWTQTLMSSHYQAMALGACNYKTLVF